ncbi:hypothetical protein O9929_08705 [Vibrio lentus]|nr:hypothetical protein [Vibrio lentus]
MVLALTLLNMFAEVSGVIRLSTILPMISVALLEVDFDKKSKVAKPDSKRVEYTSSYLLLPISWQRCVIIFTSPVSVLLN